METKQHILKAIEGLVADPRVEEAIDHFYLIFKVERGLRQAYRGELINHEETRKCMVKSSTLGLWGLVVGL